MSRISDFQGRRGRRRLWAVALGVVGAFLLAGVAAAQENAPPRKPGFDPMGQPNGGLDIPGQPANLASPVGSQVIAADLGLTPGFKSLVFGLQSGRLYVVRRNSPASWGVAAGWPQQLPAHVYSSPAVGNLDNDFQPEIVVGYGAVASQNSTHGGLRAFNVNGTMLWEVLTGDVTPGPANGFRDPVMSTPAIGDVDGDGTPEVVFGGLDHLLYVVNGENGLSNNPAIWPMDMQDTVFSSPVLHDLDGVAGAEIIVGTDAFLNSGGRLRVLRFNGTEMPGFPQIVDQVVSSSPAVGDIDGDGQPEIVHGTGSFFPGRQERVYAWNCDGTPVSGWPVTTDGEVITSPALANLDGDPQLEVVVTSSSPASSDGNFRVYAFNGNGSQIFSTRVCDFFSVFEGDSCSSLSASEPVVADALDSNAGLEILVPTNGEVAVFSASGVPLTDLDALFNEPGPVSLRTQASLGAVAVTDLEIAGAGSPIEVIAVSARDTTVTVVHVWNPNATNTLVTPPWGFFHQNERRTGTPPGTPSCVAFDSDCTPNAAAADFFTLTTPCRLFDTRDPNGPFGGPALGSGVPRTFTFPGTCGIPVGAKAISVTMTALLSSGAASVRYGNGGACSTIPNWTAVFVPAGQLRSSNAMLSLDANRSLVVQATVAGGGTVHLILDVNGYFF